MSNSKNVVLECDSYENEYTYRIDDDIDETRTSLDSIETVASFEKQLTTQDTINVFQTHPLLIPSVSNLVHQYYHNAVGMEFYQDFEWRNEVYWDNFRKYETAKNILNQTSELLFPYSNEPDVNETTYLDLFKFWIRIGNDFLDRAKGIADTYWKGGTSLIAKSTYSGDLEVTEDVDKVVSCIRKIAKEIENYEDGIYGAERGVYSLTPANTFKCLKDKEVQKFSKEEVKDYYLRCKKHLKFLKSKHVKLTSFYRIENAITKMHVYKAVTRNLIEYVRVLQALSTLMEAHPSELMSVYLEDNPELNEFVKSTIQDIIKFNDNGIGNVSEDRIGYEYWKTINRKINDPIDARSFSELTIANISKCSTIYLKKSARLGLKDFDLTMIDVIVKYFYFMEKIYFQATEIKLSNRGDI